ncbi:retrovirus-related Pol polyprotein from transposon 297 [Trichonephila clavipes]|nr:retrovirus-related Pol polyprotein from transposon 297 [Trichonephila clavipes]
MSCSCDEVGRFLLIVNIDADRRWENCRYFPNWWERISELGGQRFGALFPRLSRPFKRDTNLVYATPLNSDKDIFALISKAAARVGEIPSIFEREREIGKEQRLVSESGGVNISKSTLGVTHLQFLGYLITPEGSKPLPEKVDAILSYKLPETIRDLRTFLGLLNFYRRYSKNAAKHQAILHEYLIGSKKNDKKIVWTEEAKENFEKCKQDLAHATLLRFPDPNLQLALFTDASNFAIGSVLQQFEARNWKPISCFSKKLTEAQKNYSTYDRELLGIYLSVKQFKHLLEGRNFVIYTDHKPITYAFHQKNEKASPRQLRHLQYISQFSTNICHISRGENIVADSLSRIESISEIYYDKIADAQVDNEELNKLRLKPSLNFKQYPLDSGKLLWCDISTANIRPFIPQPLRMHMSLRGLTFFRKKTQNASIKTPILPYPTHDDQVIDSLNPCPDKEPVLPRPNVNEIAANSRFLILSLTNNDMSKKSPFAIHKALIGIGGEPKSVKRLRSDSPITISTHKTLNSCGGVISESDLLTTPDAEILDGFSDQGVIQLPPTYAQATKPLPISVTTQTDENITKLKCPPLKLLAPLSSKQRTHIPTAVTTSSSAQTHLLPSISSKTSTTSDPQPPTPISKTKGKIKEQPSQLHRPRKDSKTIDLLSIKPTPNLKKNPAKNTTLKISREQDSPNDSTPVSKRSRRRKTSKTSDAMDTDANPSDSDCVIGLASEEDESLLEADFKKKWQIIP